MNVYRKATPVLAYLAACAGLLAPIAAQSYQWSPRDGVFPRQRSAAVFDPARNRVVTVGGLSAGASHQILEWDGSNWELREPATYGAINFLSQLGEAAAYDEARGELLAYTNGGTRTWDGHEWRDLAPTQTPTASIRTGMAYDRARSRVVLFGGSSVGASFLDQTWEWDGTNWAQRFPTNSPPARTTPAIAWDETTQTVVMFGGDSGGGPLTDTWSWDGTDWTLLQPATSPPGASWQSMVYDRFRQTDVMVQRTALATTMTTWEWNGSDWAQIATATSPPLINEPSLAFDGACNEVLLAFGTNGNNQDGTTWTYDGSDWTLADVRPRYNFGVVVDDHTRGRLVMLDNALYTDYRTWEWDGLRWEAMTAANEPTTTQAGAMAYDPISQRVLMVGGVDSSFMRVDDQWEWNGSAWTLNNPTVRPSARSQSAMAFDAARGQMVLFGGVDGSTYYDDTWLWNGSSWTQANPANQPPARRYGQMAYDEVRQRIVLSGGIAASSFSDTWEWDGVNWTEVVTPGPALNTFFRWSFYDDTIDRVVVAGTDTSSTPMTWSWDGSVWTQMGPGATAISMTYDRARQQVVAVDSLSTSVGRTAPSNAPDVTENGTGCTGSNGVPTLAERGIPFLGNPDFVLEVGSGRSNSIGAFLLGETTASIPVGGCTIAIGSPNSALLFLTNDYGFGELTIPIPTTLGLMGYAFSAQGIVLDPVGAGAGLLTATAELRITVGN